MTFCLTCVGMDILSFVPFCAKTRLLDYVKKASEYVTAGVGVLLVNPWSISSWLLGPVLVSLQKDTAGTERLWRGWQKLLKARMKIDPE